MAGLTLSQIQNMGGTPVQAPVIPSVQGLTQAQVLQMGGKPTQTDNAGNPIQWAGNQIAGAFKGGIEQIKQGYKQGLEAKNPLQLIESGLKTGAGLVTAVASPLAPITAPISAGVNAAADKLANTDLIKGAAGNQVIENGQVAYKQNPISGGEKLTEDVLNTATIAQGVMGLESGPKIKGAVNTGIDAVKNTVTDLTKETPISPLELQTKLQGVADDWAKPSTINEPKYNNARAVLQKSPEAPTVLAQNGLNPFSHIEDGKYVTLDTVKQLRTDTGKLSRDILRPSLEAADYSIERTPIADLKPKVNEFGVTPDVSEKLGGLLDSKLQALERKYPDGMSLTNMLDEKITYDKNGGYSQFKSNADTNEAIANRSIADNLRTQITTKFPLAEDFFAEQAKNYQAADYLKALNGVKAPVDIGQNIARNVAKFGGAKLGAMFGGDVVSSFAGYQIGKVLEKFIENMTNPMRDSFLQNLKITNPEAFTKMEQFMGKTEADRATILKLPAGSPLGSGKNPIITPAPTEKVQMQGRANSIK